MATYYVRTNGSDSAAGSSAAPWASLKKALASAASGDSILVGDGVYAENDSGTLQIKRQFASTVTVAAENGAAGSVTIRPTSGSLSTYISAATAYLRFQYLTFSGFGAALYALRINAAADHIDFEHCTFTPLDGAATTLFVLNSGAWNISNVSFSDCVFNKPASGAAHNAISLTFSAGGVCQGLVFTRCQVQSISYAVMLNGADNVTFEACSISSQTDHGVTAAAAPDAIRLQDCQVSAAKSAVILNGGVGWEIIGGSYSNSGAYSTLQFGLDAASGGLLTTVTVRGAQVSHPPGLAGHAVLLGNGCSGCLLDGLSVTQCSDYAVVVKEHSGSEVRFCRLQGGSGAALYFKAALAPNAHHNTLLAGSGVCFMLLKGDTGAKNQDWTLSDNRLDALTSGALFNVGGALHDAGGGVCNSNFYLAPAGRWGTLRGAPLYHLLGLRAAWAGYGDGSNDRRSMAWRPAAAELAVLD